MMALLLLGVAILLLILRVELVLILMFVAGAAQLIWGGGALEYFLQDMWATMDRELLLSVPLFILVGAVMGRGSIAERLVTVMSALTRPIPGHAPCFRRFPAPPSSPCWRSARCCILR